MNRYFLVILTFSFLPFCLISQDIAEAFTFAEGPEINDFKPYNAAEYLGSVGKESFVLRSRTNTSFPMLRIRLEKLDESNNLIEFVDLDINEVKLSNERCFYHSGLLFGNYIILIYRTAEAPFSIYYQAFDLQLKEVAHNQLIETIETNSGTLSLIDSRIRVITKKSEDASKLLVFYFIDHGRSLLGPGKDPRNNSGFCVINEKLEKLQERTIGYPFRPLLEHWRNSYTEPGFGINTEIDNQGTVHMFTLTYVKEEQETDSGEGRKLEHNIVSFKVGKEEINKIRIPDYDLIILDALLKILPSGDLFCAYKRPSYDEIPTVYRIQYFLINTSTNTLEKEEVITLSSEEILKYESEKSRTAAKKLEAKGNGYAFTSLDFRDFICTSNGNYLVLEELSANFSATSNEPDIASNYIYSADDIMVIVFNDQFEKTSVQIIPKDQYSKKGWDYLSYTALDYKDGIVFLLNDNIENEEFDINEKTHQWKENMKGKGELAGYFIDSSGNLKRYSLYKSSEEDFVDIKMSGADNIQDSNVICLGKSKKGAKFFRFSLDR